MRSRGHHRRRRRQGVRRTGLTQRIVHPHGRSAITHQALAGAQLDWHGDFCIAVNLHPEVSRGAAVALNREPKLEWLFGPLLSHLPRRMGWLARLSVYFFPHEHRRHGVLEQVPASVTTRFKMEFVLRILESPFLSGIERMLRARAFPFANGIQQRRREGVLPQRLWTRHHRKSRAIARRTRQHPFHFRQRRVFCQQVPPQHMRHVVSIEQRLIVDPVLLHAFLEPTIPRFAPVVVRADVPVKRFAGAGAIDQIMRRLVEHVLGEHGQRIVALPRRESALVAIKVDVVHAGFVQEVSKISRDLALHREVGEEHLVTVIEQFPHRVTAPVGRRRGAKRSTLAVLQSVRPDSGNRLVLYELLPDLHRVEMILLFLAEELRRGHHDLTLLCVDGTHQY